MIFQNITNKLLTDHSQYRLFMSSTGLRVFRSEANEVVYAEASTLSACLLIANNDCEQHLTYEQSYLAKDAPYNHHTYGSDQLVPIDKLLMQGTVIIKCEEGTFTAVSDTDESMRVNAENFDDLIIKLDELCRSKNL